jgi:hypothetical protein
MDKNDAVVRSVAAQAGPRSRFLLPSDSDELLGITLALAGEVTTLYERLDTLERVIEQELALSREKLDGYEPTQADLAERGRWHEAFVNRLMRSLTQELARIKAQDGPPIPQGSGGE